MLRGEERADQLINFGAEHVDYAGVRGMTDRRSSSTEHGYLHRPMGVAKGVKRT